MAVPHAKPPLDKKAQAVTAGDETRSRIACTTLDKNAALQRLADWPMGKVLDRALHRRSMPCSATGAFESRSNVPILLQPSPYSLRKTGFR